LRGGNGATENHRAADIAQPTISGISKAHPGLPAAHRDTSSIVGAALLTSSGGTSSAGGDKQTLGCVHHRDVLRLRERRSPRTRPVWGYSYKWRLFPSSATSCVQEQQLWQEGRSHHLGCAQQKHKPARVCFFPALRAGRVQPLGCGCRQCPVPWKWSAL